MKYSEGQEEISVFKVTFNIYKMLAIWIEKNTFKTTWCTNYCPFIFLLIHVLLAILRQEHQTGDILGDLFPIFFFSVRLGQDWKIHVGIKWRIHLKSNMLCGHGTLTSQEQNRYHKSWD